MLPTEGLATLPGDEHRTTDRQNAEGTANPVGMGVGESKEAPGLPSSAPPPLGKKAANKPTAKEADPCPICLEPVREPVLCFNCGSALCKACDMEMLKRTHVKQECPMCRHPFPKTDAEEVAMLQPNADRGAA